MRCQIVGDAGAYAGFGGALAMGPTRMMAQGVYRIPRISYECAVALTNTTPMGAFRGAGRPEAAAMLERIIDIAAAELGIDPAEMRRRNFLQPRRVPVHHRDADASTTAATTTPRSPRRCGSRATTSCAPSRPSAGPAATGSRSGSA